MRGYRVGDQHGVAEGEGDELDVPLEEVDADAAPEVAGELQLGPLWARMPKSKKSDLGDVAAQEILDGDDLEGDRAEGPDVAAWAV